MIGQLQTMVFALEGHDFGIPTNQVLGVKKINNIVPVPSVLNGVWENRGAWFMDCLYCDKVFDILN